MQRNSACTLPGIPERFGKAPVRLLLAFHAPPPVSMTVNTCRSIVQRVREVMEASTSEEDRKAGALEDDPVYK